MSLGDDAVTLRAAPGPDVSQRYDGSELRQVLEALSAGLRRPGGDSTLAGIFEEQIQRLLAMRTVRLREIPARYQARLVTPTRTAESIVVGVPTADTRGQAVLEASFAPGRLLDERDVELLTAAAQLGGLVLEAARPRSGARPRGPDGAGPLIGSTPVMQSLRERVERVAGTDFTVLVEGESGTGKELVARQIHELSGRRSGPFVAVNCAAVVETLLEAELFGIEDRTATGVRGRRGKFEHADGGTLFLDEVSDLAISAQAKLLRAIQDLAVERVGGFGTRRVNARIVAATNRPLADLVARNLFRSDLYYRLSGIEIRVPPLRCRRDDIPELARYFLGSHRATRDLSLSPAALEGLKLYQWPGNVRELERLIERAVALTQADRIDLDDLPAHVRGQCGDALGPSLAGGDSMRAWGSRYVRLVFERCGGNKQQACRELQISYHTLDAYLRYGRRLQRHVPKRVPRWARPEDGAPGRRRDE
ncbi:MAG: sigma-54-dependent Fis family transcriptional regulator [Acidobacteria bacterium]|nr:sigma-54-dependent Fis family transcriptional regulator [Acidobacteriota bacterium]